MPSRAAISGAWTAADKAAARSEMSGHAEAERQCMKGIGTGHITFDAACLRKAVPKGTNKGLWTD